LPRYRRYSWEGNVFDPGHLFISEVNIHYLEKFTGRGGRKESGVLVRSIWEGPNAEEAWKGPTLDLKFYQFTPPIAEGGAKIKGRQDVPLRQFRERNLKKNRGSS